MQFNVEFPRQVMNFPIELISGSEFECYNGREGRKENRRAHLLSLCLLYTSDAADEEDSVDLGGRRIIKKKLRTQVTGQNALVNIPNYSRISYKQSQFQQAWPRFQLL